jgi:5'-deoxynucleotidase YfbR-like HD superfamily hydrolase
LGNLGGYPWGDFILGDTMIPNVILPNGKIINGVEDIDIITCISLRNINRFPAHTIVGKFSVPEHLWLCGLLVNPYCDFMASENKATINFADTYRHHQFQKMLYEAILTHDIEEVVFNDIPTQVECLEQEKVDTRKAFSQFLGIPYASDSITAIKFAISHIDKLAAYLECSYYYSVNPHQDVISSMLSFYAGRLREYGIHRLAAKLLKMNGNPLPMTLLGL